MNWYKQFDLVWVPVIDFDAAKAFYSDILELDLVFEDAESKWAEFQISPGAKVAIHSMKVTNANPIGAIVLEVESIDKAELWLAGKGIKLTDKEEISGVAKLASFSDPDGNLIQLSQPLIGD